MGQAALFTPPPIHKTNFVLFPSSLQRSRLKQLCKIINGKFTISDDGLITIVNDMVEFHYKIYNRHMEIEEMTYTPKALPDANRCIEFLKYESYLMQKRIYWNQDDARLAHFLTEQGFRVLDEEERAEVYESFWQRETEKV